MNAWIVVAVAAFIQAASASIPLGSLGKCAGNDLILESVELGDCGNSAPIFPCPLIKGTKETLKFVFKSPTDIPEDIEIVIQGIVAGIALPWTIPKTEDGIEGKDFCSRLEPKTSPCVKADETYTFTMTLDIKESYPAIRNIIKFRVKKGFEDQIIMCIMIPSALISA